MQQIASLEPVGRPRQVPKVLDAQRSTNAAFGIVMPITPSRLVPVSRPPHYRQATTYVIGTRGNVAHPARGTPWRCSRPMGRGHSVRDGAASARGERACRSRGTSSSTNRMPPTIPPSRRARIFEPFFTTKARGSSPSARTCTCSSCPGYTDDAVVRHGMLKPGLAYLEKPFRPPALLRKVREVLDQRVAPE